MGFSLLRLKTALGFIVLTKNGTTVKSGKSSLKRSAFPTTKVILRAMSLNSEWSVVSKIQALCVTH
jgi:hypothetical protein